MKMKKQVVILTGLLVLLFAVSGCGKKGEAGANYASKLAGNVPSFNVKSESVDDNGVLKTECTYVKATPKGENQSPQLAWEKVDHATCYAVYMYDKDANNYLHWMLADVNETSIDEGSMSTELMYIGPYPLEGTHEYDITVYALKHSPKLYEGKINTFADIDKIEKNLDEIDGETGNVLAVGVKTFKVTRGK